MEIYLNENERFEIAYCIALIKKHAKLSEYGWYVIEGTEFIWNEKDFNILLGIYDKLGIKLSIEDMGW